MILYIAARLCVVTMHHTTIQQRSPDSTDLLSTINLGYSLPELRSISSYFDQSTPCTFPDLLGFL